MPKYCDCEAGKCEGREAERCAFRHAITAMREPTEAMWETALRRCGCIAFPLDEREALEAFWVAMVSYGHFCPTTLVKKDD